MKRLWTLNETAAGRGARGFTRLELVAVLAALVLLAAVALPVLATTRLQADRLGCVSNLRRIGQAYQLWGIDHRQAVPVRTPYCEGGLSPLLSKCPNTLAPPWASSLSNAWFHFAWISNELATPRILACPGDDTANVARDFSDAPDGGFMNVGYRDNALSYFVSLDVTPGHSLPCLSGDRHLPPSGSPEYCSSGVTRAQTIRARPFVESAWSSELHGGTGSMLLNDGRVLQTSTESMRYQFRMAAPAQDDYGSFHILLPRR